MSDLPNADQRWIPDSKVANFLLGKSTEKSRERLRFFQGYGFKSTEWRVLRDAISRISIDHAAIVRQDEHGTTYRTTGPLETPGGRRAKVEVFWIVRADDPRPQLTTVIPRGSWRED